jgi:hypothetical protein
VHGGCIGGGPGGGGGATKVARASASSGNALLLADEDRDGELLLLGELRREFEGLTTVSGLEILVDDMVNHDVCVIADHPAIVDLAGDLAADTRRRRGRWRLDRHVVVLVIVRFLILVIVIGGHDGRPVGVPVGIAEVASVPFWVQLPLGEGVRVRGPDVECGVAPQVHGEEASPPAYLPHALQPVVRDGRHRHSLAIEVPPHRQVDVRPRHGIAPGVEPAG